MIAAPGLRSVSAPGARATIGVFGSTTMVCSPPLYVTVSFGPVAASTRAERLPLVIELLGARSKGRKPSPAPRIASGKMWTSIALSSPPSPGTAATPMNAAGLHVRRASLESTRTKRVFGVRWIVCASPARVRTLKAAPSALIVSIVARAVAIGAFWASAGASSQRERRGENDCLRCPHARVPSPMRRRLILPSPDDALTLGDDRELSKARALASASGASQTLTSAPSWLQRVWKLPCLSRRR